MPMQKKEYSIEIGGRTLSATFSDLADQANGSVIMKYGDTSVLVTAVFGKKEKDANFFPLTVDFEERYYAAGLILGGQYNKREGRPSDEAILGGRMIDRTIRPLFDQYIRREVHIVATVLSIDEKNDPDTLGIVGASLALGTSDIPWNGPASAVHVALEKSGDGNIATVINPTLIDAPQRICDLLICGTTPSTGSTRSPQASSGQGVINMIEAESKEIAEDKVVELMEIALAEITKLQTWQKKIIAEVGKKKEKLSVPELSEEVKSFFKSEFEKKTFNAIFSGDKKQIENLQEEWLVAVVEKFPETSPATAENYYGDKVDGIVHREALESEKRPDGRKMNEVRPLFAQAGGVSNIIHGSGIFYRGGTHVLSVLTLGGPKDSQMLDGMEVRGKKYFMHHYNFPPYSTGEPGRMGGINRRSTGHGALAEKALKATLPSRDVFPYTIRIVSESTASNGSTSMGSVCASTIALMDGGVPITRPTAGIAMGLMLSQNKEGKNQKYKILTDIQGPEDHYGDMDFKVAGTTEGVTAIQMDVKIDGIPLAILKEALSAGRNARVSILKAITDEISAPRKAISPNAPKILNMKIEPDQIGTLIGTGGKTINGISDLTGAEIEIEEDGTVIITGKGDSADKTKAMIEDLFREYKPGEKLDGIVTRLMDFGAFVKIGPNAEGLVHVSEIAPFRIERVADVLKEGEAVKVVVKEIDEKKRINLSIKAVDPTFAERKGLKPKPYTPPALRP